MTLRKRSYPTHISVRGTTHAALKAYSDREGPSMSHIVETLVAKYLGLKPPKPRRRSTRSAQP